MICGDGKERWLCITLAFMASDWMEQCDLVGTMASTNGQRPCNQCLVAEVWYDVTQLLLCLFAGSSLYVGPNCSAKSV